MTALPLPQSLFRKALLKTDGPALGTWIKLPVIESVELIALAGFDFLVVDLEHSMIDLATTSALVSVALARGVAPLVRIPALDLGLIQRVLDAGAEGIMVPHVDTVEQAAAAVRAVRFPPLGSRGVGSTSRAGAWGAIPRDEYFRYGNDEVVVVPQLESAIAVRNAAAIARTKGVDALLVGTADLAASEGKADDHPDVAGLVADAVRGAAAAGRPIGNAGGASTAAVQAAVDAGFGFTMLSNDATMLGTAARAAVASARLVGAR